MRRTVSATLLILVLLPCGSGVAAGIGRASSVPGTIAPILPVPQQTIHLVSEHVHARVVEDSTWVTSVAVLRNGGEATWVTVGVPDRGSAPRAVLSVLVNGRAVRSDLGRLPSSITGGRYSWENRIDFGANETKKIRVESVSVSEGPREGVFVYDFKTAKWWAGRSYSLDLTVTLEDVPAHRLQLIRPTENDLANIGIEAEYEVDGRSIHWHFDVPLAALHAADLEGIEVRWLDLDSLADPINEADAVVAGTIHYTMGSGGSMVGAVAVTDIMLGSLDEERVEVRSTTYYADGLRGVWILKAWGDRYRVSGFVDPRDRADFEKRFAAQLNGR